MQSIITRTGASVFRFGLMATTASAAIFIAGASPAFAQDNAAAQPAEAEPISPVDTTEAAPAGDETIVVTGSRIARRDYEANSPIVTANRSLFDNSGTAALEQNLNKLPQFSANQTPFMGGDIQPTATNTPGAATISLRGIGANRNLVLIDGRRGTPANASGVVDINTIPSAAIERVENITGGASATYGADAIAGVTNFILKKNFVGLQLDGQSSISQRGDGFEYQISGIMGADFDDGRGNVSLAMSVNRREGDFQRNRKWYKDYWTDPDRLASGFFLDRPGINWGLNVPNPAATQQVMPGYQGVQSPTNPGGDPIFETFYTNPDGSVFTGTSFNTRSGVQFFNQPTDGFPYKVNAAGVLGQNDTYLYLSLPLNRYNVVARGNYEINDWIGVFGQATFTKVSTKTQNEPGPLVFGWGASIPWGTGVYVGDAELNNAGNPSSVLLNGMPGNLNDPTPTILSDNPTNPAFALLYKDILPCANNPTGGCTNTQAFQDVIPQELQTLLNSRGGPPFFGFFGNSNSNFSLTALFPELRTTLTDVTTFDMTAGLEGSIPGTDFTWTVFGSHGESHTFARQTGVYSLSRVRALLTAPNFGEGFKQKGNAEQGGFGASTGTCSTGINLFGDVSQVSEDCWEAIRADLKNRSKVVQTIWEGDLSGTLVTLPAGDLGVAVGASYRKMDFEFINDTLTTQGRSFQDQALGIYPSGNAFGTTIAREIYGEMLVPVLGDIPGIHKLTLELGARYSDYNTTGGSWTYKALADWEVTDWLRFRGGYQRAERSPNVGELYLAAQQTFGVNNVGDACSLENPAPFSANEDTNDNWANVQATCRVMMEASGDPGADDAYYNAVQSNATFGFAFPTTVGNPNLTPEKANTWTAGVVINSPFKDSPVVSRARLTVDYYNIKVDDAIGVQSIGIVQRQCFDPTFNPDITSNPTLAAQDSDCARITRNTVNGGLGDVFVTYTNNGRFRVSGLDTQFDWPFDIGPGTLALNVLFTYLFDFKVAELPVDPMIEYAGTLGTAVNGLNTNASYRWKLFSTLNYRVGAFNVGLQWQHLPSAEDATEAQFPTTTTGVDAYNIFHLNSSYAFNRDITVRFGIDNLLDKAPPIIGENPANTNPAATGQLIGGTLGTVAGNLYDLEGRRFWFGVSAKF